MGVQLTDEMISGAIATQQKYGVPASITLGQIMLESGGSNQGGLSTLAFKYNNLFGVTKGSWTGETVYMTNKNGTDGKTYRVYSSVSESIEDHAKVLLNDRYTKYTSTASNYVEYAQGIAKGGYAEDTNYANKLISIISSNNLDQYDNGTYTGGTTSNLNKNTTKLGLVGTVVRIVMILLVVLLGIIFLGLSFNTLGINPVKSFNDKGDKKDE